MIRRYLAIAAAAVFLTASGYAQNHFLQPVEGLNQIVQPGQAFALGVRLTGTPPTEGVTVSAISVLSGGPQITCSDGITDSTGLGRVVCNSTFWPIETQVLITIGAENGAVATPIAVTLRPLILPEGLTAISIGTRRITQPGDVTLSVLFARQGQPVEGLRLSVKREPDTVPISCPDVVETDAFGFARATCTVLEQATTPSAVLVTFRSPMGDTVTFTIAIDLGAPVPDGVFALSSNQVVTPQLSLFLQPLRAQGFQDGAPTSGRRFDVIVSDPSLIFCPDDAVADFDGIVHLICAAGAVVGNGSASINLVDNSGLSMIQPFQVAVVSPVVPGRAMLRLASPSPLQVVAGERKTDGVVVEAVTFSDLPLPGVPMFFSSDRNVILDPPFVLSGPNGKMTTTPTFGCPTGTGRIFGGTQPGAAQIIVDVEIGGGGPSLVLIENGAGQSGGPGQRLPRALVLRVTDQCFSGIPGRAVRWIVDPPNAATLEDAYSITNQRGQAAAFLRLGQTPGPFSVTLRSGDLSRTLQFAVVLQPSGVSAVSAAVSSVPRGEISDPLTVVVAAESGVPIPDIPVQFEITSGAGSLTDALVLTDSSGQASSRLIAPAEFGQVEITASPAPSAASAEEGLAAVDQQSLAAVFLVTVGGSRPQVPPDGFTDGASFRPGFVPGAVGTIFGAGMLEDVSGVVAASGPPFPLELSGTSVSINGFAAPIVALADTAQGQQINLQTPFETQAGPATVIISNHGTESVFENVQVEDVGPALFELALQDGLYVAALHADYRLVAPSDPARPGETILLYLTGLGAVAPHVDTNQAGPLPPAQPIVDPVVMIDAQPAPHLGAFYAPQLAMVYQINLTLPQNITSGDHGLVVTAAGASSQTALLPVRR